MMWQNIVEPGRLYVAIWHMHIACWIPRSTNIHPEYAICIGFPL